MANDGFMLHRLANRARRTKEVGLCLHVDLVHFQPNCSPRVRDDEFGPVELSRPLHGASLTYECRVRD